MSEEPNVRGLMSPQAAADYLGTTAKALENWRGAGAGPVYIKLSRKCVKYAPSDLDAYIDSCRRTSTAQH